MTGFRLTFISLLLAMLLAALDQTIVATALPTIVQDLGGIDDLSWVVTAYLLGATVTTPLWGRASDLFGRKTLFQASIVVFLVGSALSGAAGSLGELVTFRALQGTGAGGLMTLAMAIVADIVAPRDRGRYQGYIQMVFVGASIAGPLLGGVFTDQISWRWVFYVNVPIGLVALTLATIALELPAERTPARIDWTGAALLTSGLAALLLATTELSIPLGAVAAVLLIAFIRQERRAPEPIMPLRLFRQPVFSIVSAALFLTALAFFAAIVFLPVYLQVVTGASATESGLLMLPMLLSGLAATALSGRVISRTGRYKRYPLAGLSLMAVGLLGLSTMDASTGRVTTAALMVVFGVGFGLVTQVLVLAIQNSVEPREIGITTATANLFRALGGSIGTAVFGAVFAAHGVETVFLVAAPFAVAALIVVTFLTEVPLRGAANKPQRSDHAQRAAA
jgi:EmrB/QacA subfamily drug resistance transporter